MFVKQGAVREAGAVNALEHGAVFVPLVEGARHAHDFECLAVARAAHVGTGAQVRKIPVAVEGNLLVFRDVVQQVNLEAGRLTAGAQGTQLPGFRHLHGIRAGNDFLLENLVFLHHFFHLLLNAFKILCADAVVQLHVVIKTVIHHGTYGKVACREYGFYRLGEHVRAGMAVYFKPLLILERYKLYLIALRKGRGKVGKLAVYFCRNRISCKRFAYGFCRVGTSCTVFKRQFVAVFKKYLHGSFS